MTRGRATLRGLASRYVSESLAPFLYEMASSGSHAEDDESRTHQSFLFKAKLKDRASGLSKAYPFLHNCLHE